MSWNQKMFEQSFGVAQKRVIDNASGAVINQKFRCVELLKATTITALTSGSTTDAAKLLNTELPAGTVIWDVQAITVAAGGLVVAHGEA